MDIPHPDIEQIELPLVLTALGDETRLAIIGHLARHGGIGMTCGQFLGLASKTSLSYHLARLREAGVIHIRPEGTRRLVTLRRDDLDLRFPGFLDAVIASAALERRTAGAAGLSAPAAIERVGREGP